MLRFDNRDAGLSTHLPDGLAFDVAAARHGGRDAVAYTLDDMADDTAGSARSARHRRTRTWSVPPWEA